MNKYKIKILHLFPDLLDLYGDKGNIECMRKRLEWRSIEVEIINAFSGDDIDLSNIDILFLGGGTDKAQCHALNLLLPQKDKLKAYVEQGNVLLAVCDGFYILGSKYQTQDKVLPGLEILDVDIKDDFKGKRATGNVVLTREGFKTKIVGFENHSKKIYIGKYSPLGTIQKGFGNDGESKEEGLVYKNLFATSLYGPLLPKNPELCDFILSRALFKKYPDFKGLKELDDTIENLANDYINCQN